MRGGTGCFGGIFGSLSPTRYRRGWLLQAAGRRYPAGAVPWLEFGRTWRRSQPPQHCLRSCSQPVASEAAYLASVLLVELEIGHTHCFVRRGAVTEEATVSCAEQLFQAQIGSTADGKPGRGPLREARGRLPEPYYCGGAIFLGCIKRGAGRRGVSRWGTFYASRKAGEAVFHNL